jgi:hypothetical protein
MPVPPEDEMVVHDDPEGIEDGDDLAGHADIGRRWLGIA